MVDWKMFNGNTHALQVFLYAMSKPSGFVFRKSEIKESLGLTEWFWDKARRFLEGNGIMSTAPFHNKEKGKIERVVKFDFSSAIASKCGVGPLSSPCSISVGGCKGGDARGAETKIEEQKMNPELAQKHQERFLAHFTGIKTFQTFDDTKSKLPKLARIIHNNTAQLQQLNRQGAGIFLTINETDGKGRSRENISRVRAIWVDLDGAPIEPVLQDMPHMVVESSPGKYHAYWFVKDFPLEGFSQTQKRLIEKYNGDKAVHDLPRVMRIPGFWHLKGEPFCSRIVFESQEEPLTYAQVCEKFPPKLVKKWTAPKHQHVVSGQGEYRGPYGTGAGGRNNGLARFIGGMVKRNFDHSHIHNEAMKWGMSCSPPMEREEIEAVVRSVGRYQGC